MALFPAILLNVLVPILLAGAFVYVIAMPGAPLSPRGKQLATWVAWAVAILWIVLWLLRLLGAFGPSAAKVG